MGIEYPVVIEGERWPIWNLYGNRGWPARYLWNQQGYLHDYHYGEGAYDETELAIQELLGVEREPVVAPRCAPRTSRARCSHRADRRPAGRAYSGPYEAGGALGRRLEGRGVLDAPTDAELPVDHAGCLPIVEHPAGDHSRGRDRARSPAEGVTVPRHVLHARRRAGISRLGRPGRRSRAGAPGRGSPARSTRTALPGR